MSPHPTAAITIADGEITVDAELLAPKLGLSAAALKAEMRKTAVIAYGRLRLKGLLAWWIWVSPTSTS